MAGSDERLVRTWRRAVEALKPPADIRRALRVDQAITDDGRVRLDRAYGPLQPENAALLDAVSVAVNAPDDLSAAVNLEDRLVAHGDAVAAIDATVDALLITPFIVQTPSAVLTAEQALSTLATGLLKNTTGTGVLSIATGADVPAHNHTPADVTGFDEAAQDAVGNALVDGTGINFTYNDGSNQITAEPIFAGTGSAGTVARSDHNHDATYVNATSDSMSGDLTVFGNLTVGGYVSHTGTQFGFFNAAPGTKPTITGSRGGNAALASLLSALATLGLITNSSSA